jgi:hypothetical protein
MTLGPEEERQMTNPPDKPDVDAGAAVGPEHRVSGGTSHWQKVVAIIGLLVLLGLGIRMFAIGSAHGSGQNAPVENQEQDSGGHEPPPWAPDH